MSLCSTNSGYYFCNSLQLRTHDSHSIDYTLCLRRKGDNTSWELYSCDISLSSEDAPESEHIFDFKKISGLNLHAICNATERTLPDLCCIPFNCFTDTACQQNSEAQELYIEAREAYTKYCEAIENNVRNGKNISSAETTTEWFAEDKNNPILLRDVFDMHFGEGTYEHILQFNSPLKAITSLPELSVLNEHDKLKIVDLINRNAPLKSVRVTQTKYPNISELTLSLELVAF